MSDYTARLRCLRDFAVVLPERDVYARKGEVITVDLRAAVLMERYGLGKIVAVQRRE